MEFAIVLLTLMLGAFLIWLFFATGSMERDKAPKMKEKEKPAEPRPKLSKELLEEYQKRLEKDNTLVPPPLPGDDEEFDDESVTDSDDSNYELEKEANEKQPALREGIRDTPLKRWSVAQVALFLEALEMAEYVPSFVKAGVTGEKLLVYADNPKEFVKLGVTHRQDRKRLEVHTFVAKMQITNEIASEANRRRVALQQLGVPQDKPAPAPAPAQGASNGTPAAAAATPAGPAHQPSPATPQKPPASAGKPPKRGGPTSPSPVPVEKDESCDAILEGHSDWVTALAWLGGGRVASGSADSTIRLWRVEAPYTCECCLEGHVGAVRAVALLDAATGTIVSAGDDCTVRTWIPPQAHCEHILEGHKDAVYALCVLHDKRVVSGSADNTLIVWSAADGQIERVLKGHLDFVLALASLGGSRVASGGWDKDVRLWDVDSGRCLRVLSGHAGYVRSLVALRGGEAVASGSADGTIKVWPVPDIYFSNPEAKGPEAALARGETVPPLTIPVAGNQHVYGLACPEGSLVAAGLADGRLMVYDSATGACTRVLHGHSKRIYAVAAAGGGRVATASRDKDVRVWTASHGAVRAPARAEGVPAAQGASPTRPGARAAGGRGGAPGASGGGDANGGGGEDLSKLHPLLGGTMKVKEAAAVGGTADGWKAFLGAAGTEPFGGPYGDGESADDEEEEDGEEEEEVGGDNGGAAAAGKRAGNGSAQGRVEGMKKADKSGASLEELD